MSPKKLVKKQVKRNEKFVIAFQVNQTRQSKGTEEIIFKQLNEI